MTTLADSLSSLTTRLLQITEIVGTAQKTAQTITASSPTPPQSAPVPIQPQISPLPEKRIQITLDFPKSGKSETIITDEKSADALTRFMTNLRSEWERS